MYKNRIRIRLKEVVLGYVGARPYVYSYNYFYIARQEFVRGARVPEIRWDQARARARELRQIKEISALRSAMTLHFQLRCSWLHLPLDADLHHLVI